MQISKLVTNAHCLACNQAICYTRTTRVHILHHTHTGRCVVSGEMHALHLSSSGMERDSRFLSGEWRPAEEGVGESKSAVAIYVDEIFWIIIKEHLED
ncbi:hypothetical protein NDU88_002758 [Pleurodeles waltl]|uniref:Uncharacterized protein n=1 Tax=Pleurodeles waltl TaxID=8319 RepID=A0AAV7T2W5_PLEWA|nr:hypothetical protein NDU88_002758 [Pleurodeles waltl]